MDKSNLIKEIKKLHSLVKTTRIHIMRKLIRDKKVCASKATSNSSNDGAKKKAETTEAILNHIKTMSPSVLIEAVLQYQPLKNGESLESAPLEQQSMARFLQDPKLDRYLKSLENQLGAGANAILLDALQKKRTIKYSVAKIQQKERIKKVLQNKKENRKNQRKEIKSLKEKARTSKQSSTDGPNPSHGTDDDEKQTTVVCDTYESDDNSEEEFDKQRLESDESDTEEESDQEERLSISVSEDENCSSDETASDQAVVEPQVKRNGEAKQKDTPQLVKPSISKPNQSDIQNMKSSNKKNDMNYKAPEEEDEQDGYEMVTDSFFVTDTGEQYKAVAPKLKPTADDDVESDDGKQSWKLKNRRKRREKQSLETDPTEAFATDLNQAKQRKVNNFTKEKFTTNKQTYTSVKTQNLHPSWAAKQAQKGIKPFAGKKVMFDAEDGGVSSSTYAQPAPAKFKTKNDNLHPSWAAKQAQKGIKPFTGKKIVFDTENTNSVENTNSKKSFNRTRDLHPSWAAKQAQNGIKSFTSKKTAFNDDGNNTNDFTRRVAPKSISKKDLHPSWAAKQAQNGIKPFAGKKITFNTDDTGKRNKPGAIKLTSTSKAPKGTDLHPSWAAKQAQKAILPFAGKKITFDSENKANESTTAPRFLTGASKHHGNVGSKSQPNNTASVHPSWAAKQAQSGIKPFAGTKISFDD
ncbi:inner centromere protein A [Anopheles marshallii]|uniref:inner centromere protein A n=1 Tax=Anopheles marshallii TaxID=1521116 RepID=UPI00237A4C0D|nr:inner centromere protein A [Anopheles marshallii]